MGKLNVSQFKFRKHEAIGAEGAEEDKEFLLDCFVDTGDLKVLLDVANPKRIIVGRTGTGKTALLLLLQEKEEHVAWIRPEQLALQFLANSTILKHLEEIGVKLDIFYRLLWRHIFTVELIQLKYNLRSESDQKNFLQRITGKLFGDKKKKEALDYLVEWGAQFWKDTEYRIHEVTKKLESDIQASLGSKFSLLNTRIGSQDSYSTEDRAEIVHRAQEVVNGVQIQKLARIIEILAEDVFGEPYPKYFVVIDQLDENWVDDPLRYRLIRALIETIKDMQQIRSAKFIVALRKDLLDRVFRVTRDSGFQEEKYQPLFLHLRWTKEHLLEVLDKRINKLVQKQYTKQPVSWRQIFPPRIGNVDTGEYLVCRTMYRPRDIIEFGNCCINMAVNRSEITVTMIREAEATYSNLRLRSLFDEWIADYSGLQFTVSILRKRPYAFHLEDVTEPELDKYCLMAFERGSNGSKDRVDVWATEVLFNKMSLQSFWTKLIKIFYEIGLVGLKTDKSIRVSWSFLERDTIGEAEIRGDTRVEICPMFYRALGTDLRS